MYTKCIQNVYHVSTNFCIHFVYNIKRTMVTNFVYKMYTKVCRNVEYILHTNILHIFCIHQFDLQKVYIIKIMYTIWIQNLDRIYVQIIACKMDPTFKHILTHLLCTSKLVNHCTQLRLETCWLSMEISIKSMD